MEELIFNFLNNYYYIWGNHIIRKIDEHYLIKPLEDLEKFSFLFDLDVSTFNPLVIKWIMESNPNFDVKCFKYVSNNRLSDFCSFLSSSGDYFDISPYPQGINEKVAWNSICRNFIRNYGNLGELDWYKPSADIIVKKCIEHLIEY